MGKPSPLEIANGIAKQVNEKARSKGKKKPPMKPAQAADNDGDEPMPELPPGSRK